MHPSIIIFLALSSLVRLTSCTPLCADIVAVAGGGLPNGEKPIFISEDAVSDIQLALYLENLESSFFRSGLQNISSWVTQSFPNDTTEILSKIAAVSL